MRNITVGIDVGTQSSRVIVGEYENGHKFPAIIGMGVAESRGLRHGYVMNRQEARKSVERAVREAERASKIKIKSAFASIGGISLDSVMGTGSAVISKGDGEVTELDMKKAVADSEKSLGTLENRRILHTIPVKWKLDGKEIWGRPAGMHGLKLEVKTMFVTCLKQHLDDLVEIIEDAGVEVADVVASPISASLVTLNRRQKTAGSVLVNIGAETVSMVVFENDTPVFLHVFPIGGTDITNDIALGLKIPIEEAEEIKTGGLDSSSRPRRKLEEIIEARLIDIFELVETYLKKIGRSGLLPAGIVITGGGAQISLIEELAKKTLDLPARITTPDLLENSKGKVGDPSWAVAYGLLMISDRSAHNGGGLLGEFLKKTKAILGSSLKELLP
ncbi:MAG: cell division protein FtsA [Patescibacteria group bacterium]